LPGGGRKYSGTHSKGLIWLKNEAGCYFPNHLVRKGTKSVILYSHGNGGSLGDFKSIVWHYAQWFNTSVFAIEYPGYGPAEGVAGEESVNDNLRTAYNFLLFLGYPAKNIVFMGYSIGTGPSIQLASELCQAGTPPGALITIAAYLSICDIVRDLKGSIEMIRSILAGVIDNRWDSGTKVASVTCPSLFVHGALDEVIPCEHSERLFANCASAVKRLRICPKADHTHFEEPSDTVDPIANFLSEVFRPDQTAQIIQIPARFTVCPESVLQREALAKQRENISIAELGFQGFGDTCESTCFNIFGFFDWMVGNKVTGSTKTTMPDNITVNGAASHGQKGASSSATAAAAAAATSAASAGGGGFGDDETAAGAAGAKSPGGQFVLPGQNTGPSVLAPLQGTAAAGDGGPSSSSSSSSARPREYSASVASAASSSATTNYEGMSTVTMQSSSTRAGPAVVATGASASSADAMKVLRGYYDAFNKHDILAAVAYLAPDVKVKFPDSKKNWSSSAAAFDRYTTMFRKSPSLKGKFSLLDVVHESSRTTIAVYCHFTCNVSGVDTVREMVYVVEGHRITIIDNKY